MSPRGPEVRVHPDSSRHPSHPPPPRGPATPAVLGYSRAAPDEHVELSPPLALKLVGPPILLTLAAAYVVGSAAHDADPFGDNFRQSFLYALLAPSLIVLWLAWAAAFLVLILRRRLHTLLAVPLALLALWGGMVCLVLHQTTAEFIDQTSRFHGARWPFLDRFF